MYLDIFELKLKLSFQYSLSMSSKIHEQFLGILEPFFVLGYNFFLYIQILLLDYSVLKITVSIIIDVIH